MRFHPASYLTFCLSVPLVFSVAQGTDGRSAPNATLEAATPKVESIPIPGTKAFPESITSTTDGTLYVGRLGDGGIVRVKPRTPRARFSSNRAHQARARFWEFSQTRHRTRSGLARTT